jgi:hypothetical protein
MDQRLRELVRQRSGDRCEYCRLPQGVAPVIRFHVEHVVARVHGGSDDPANLALACPRCNCYKGTNLSAPDPQTTSVTMLFHPRQHSWDEHFRFDQGVIVGLTATGRATVHLLRMNDQQRLRLRTELLRRNEL